MNYEEWLRNQYKHKPLSNLNFRVQAAPTDTFLRSRGRSVADSGSAQSTANVDPMMQNTVYTSWTETDPQVQGMGLGNLVSNVAANIAAAAFKGVGDKYTRSALVGNADWLASQGYKTPSGHAPTAKYGKYAAVPVVTKEAEVQPDLGGLDDPRLYNTMIGVADIEGGYMNWHEVQGLPKWVEKVEDTL